MSLTPWVTVPEYIFAKFVLNYIFLQNRDKLNIKKILGSDFTVDMLGFTVLDDSL
jgi:hypothetical protein